MSPAIPEAEPLPTRADDRARARPRARTRERPRTRRASLPDAPAAHVAGDRTRSRSTLAPIPPTAIAPRAASALRSLGLLGATLVAATLLAACDGTTQVDAGDIDAPPIEPSIAIGTGEIEFVPITDGQNLQFVQGPQGGYHFLASMRVTGVDPGDRRNRDDPRNPTTEFRAYLGDQRVDLMASRYVQGLDASPGLSDTYEMVGRLLILDITDPAQLRGMDTRLEVTVTDADGVTLTDSRTVGATF